MTLHENNTQRPGATTRIATATRGPIIIAIVALALTSPVHAQAGPGADGAESSLPHAADVVQAFAALRRWTDAFSVPSVEDPSASARLRGAHGVCVIVRRSGRVLGTGTDASGDALMLRRAAGRAFGEMLSDPVVANLPRSILASMGPKLTIELEVAGRPEPLLGRTFDEFASQLEPGMDGLAVRRGDDWAIVFPAQLRLTNSAGDAPRRILPLAVELGLPATAPRELLKRPDVSIYKFRTTHLTQTAPDKRPFSTVRGDLLVSQAQVTPQAVVTLADGIARHLLKSLSPARVSRGLMGTYQPHLDQYEPLIAPAREQALAALALSSYALAPGVDVLIARRAASAAHQILSQLQAQVGGQEDPLADLQACAAIVYAIFQDQRTMQDPTLRPLLSAAAARTIDAFSAEGGFVQRGIADGPAQAISPNGQAMLAAALSRLLQRGYPHDRLTPQLVRSAIDTAWLSVPEHRQVMLLPWLGWAELEYSLSVVQPPANADRLNEIRRLLHASQIGSESLPGAADLVGGFVLSRGPATMANAQTLRPAAFLATMVRNPLLTPAQEAQSAMNRHLVTVRFLIQLTIRENWDSSLQNPSRAVGGLRAALWDTRQPVAAQALGLLTASETLYSFTALAQRRGNP